MNEILGIRTALAENKPNNAVQAIQTQMGFDYFLSHYKSIEASFKQHWIYYTANSKICRSMTLPQILLFLKSLDEAYIEKKKTVTRLFYRYGIQLNPIAENTMSHEGAFTPIGLCIGFDFQVYIALAYGDEVLHLDTTIAKQCLMMAESEEISFYIQKMEQFAIRGSQKNMPTNLLIQCGEMQFLQSPFYIPLISTKHHFDRHTAKDE